MGEAVDNLTTREIQLIRLLALGHTNAEIAEKLVISVRTVEWHRAQVQKKLGVHTRAELVRFAIEHDLVSF